MARKLKNFEPPKGKGGRKPTYPWDRWFDGATWELTQGKDFTGTLRTMQKLIRETALATGKAISVYRTSDKTLVLSPRSAR